MGQSNAATVRRFLTAWFQGDTETWRELAAPDVIVRMAAKPTGSPLLKVEVDDVVADDRFAMAIVHTVYQGEREPLELVYACAHKLDPDGKVTEVWHLSDKQAAARQLLIPGTAEPAAGEPGA